ncbi:MAG: response regulator [Phycisphaerales bacterium]|nr:response regulator [Phycisphaerales bacterium]
MGDSPLQNKSILIVDDDPDIITALTTVFAETGATVTTAQDGNEAVEKAERDHPDLVILDAMLPKRSGFLVLERLKRPTVGGTPPPRIIMITGNQGKRHQQWAESLGVDAYINKPFRMERLMQSAEALVGKAKG